MSDPKPIASLSPLLLARKGGARPAMRSQLQAMPQHFHEGTARVVEDDLGWNDMGDAEAASVTAEAVLHQAEIVTLVTGAATVPADVPEVVRQQEAMTARLAVPAKAPARPRRRALDDGRRAAFTLRLDAERHLKLRLACTIRNRSAQQLVIDALDQLIDSMPDLDTLAAQVAKNR
jgi:hypothetical protein